MVYPQNVYIGPFHHEVITGQDVTREGLTTFKTEPLYRGRALPLRCPFCDLTIHIAIDLTPQTLRDYITYEAEGLVGLAIDRIFDMNHQHRTRHSRWYPFPQFKLLLAPVRRTECAQRPPGPGRGLQRTVHHQHHEIRRQHLQSKPSQRVLLVARHEAEELFRFGAERGGDCHLAIAADDRRTVWNPIHEICGGLQLVGYAVDAVTAQFKG